jgi:ankyrin repeat protein
VDADVPTRAELNRYNARAQALGDAAARGDLKAMSAMLADDPSLAKHSRPFSDACKAGQPEAVRVLIGAGVDVNTAEGSGPPRSGKALLWAIRPLEWTTGHRRVVEILLDHGADPSGIEGDCVVTPLLAAAEWNHPEAVGLLLERGARVGFYEAVAIADHDRVEAFLAESPRLATAVRRQAVGFHDGPGTALHIAALSRLGNDDRAVGDRLASIAESLIARGAPARSATLEGQFIPGPIANAARSGNVAVLSVLLRHGADPQDALAPALGGSAMDVLENLTAFPLDVELPGDPKLGNTILQDLIRYGKLRSAEWLIGRGARVGGVDRNGWTALHYACSRGVGPEFAQLLLDRGAELNPRDATGATPLALARRGKPSRLAEFLTERGATT